eukprot:GFKZ01013116.1.p1 GENE.GFKZ01013116.1~~GFKZ01013116.1.p1  ORF type:complete len:139 (+),score=0.47 GFKZ01013116.1:185-601(+)
MCQLRPVEWAALCADALMTFSVFDSDACVSLAKDMAFSLTPCEWRFGCVLSPDQVNLATVVRTFCCLTVAALVPSSNGGSFRLVTAPSQKSRFSALPAKPSYAFTHRTCRNTSLPNIPTSSTTPHPPYRAYPSVVRGP